MIRLIKRSVIAMAAVIFAFYSYLCFMFASLTWPVTGPSAVYLHGEWFDTRGPLTTTYGERPCRARHTLGVTGIHWCRAIPEEASTIIITWYNGDKYGVNVQNPR